MRIFISAGEVSGDLHGAALARALTAQAPSITLDGLGSTQMRASGVHLLADPASRSTMGFIEPLAHVPYFLSLFRNARRYLRKKKPDAVVLIDFQGINLPLAKAARKLGVPTVYYIPPQEWIWGTKKGAQAVVDHSDLILSVFKPEADFYERLGGKVQFIGHPLLDIIEESKTRRSAGLAPNGSSSPVIPAEAGIQAGEGSYGIALFPGSRKQEVASLLPVMLRIAAAFPEHRYIVVAASPTIRAQIEKLLTLSPSQKIEIKDGDPYSLMSAADLIITASGTTTLEAACLHAPMVVLYKLSALSYFVAKHILKVKIPHIALPNILAQRRVVPEFILNETTESTVLQTVRELLQDSAKRAAMARELKSVSALLGAPGATQRAAEQIISYTNS